MCIELPPCKYIIVPCKHNYAFIKNKIVLDFSVINFHVKIYPVIMKS